jgi:carbohydrate kinase (thermoresistant glucokinase family)
MKMIIVLMGVSGCGKTSVAQALSNHFTTFTTFTTTFIEGDLFHPSANLSKMQSGISLNDDDRLPWLQKLASLLKESTFDITILSCSALKMAYRNILRCCKKDLKFVWLHGSESILLQRMNDRDSSHFMKSGMLRSQLATLEPPLNEVDIYGPININSPIASILAQIISLLHPPTTISSNSQPPLKHTQEHPSPPSSHPISP